MVSTCPRRTFAVFRNASWNPCVVRVELMCVPPRAAAGEVHRVFGDQRYRSMYTFHLIGETLLVRRISSCQIPYCDSRSIVSFF